MNKKKELAVVNSKKIELPGTPANMISLAIAKGSDLEKLEKLLAVI